MQRYGLSMLILLVGCAIVSFCDAPFSYVGGLLLVVAFGIGILGELLGKAKPGPIPQEEKAKGLTIPKVLENRGVAYGRLEKGPGLLVNSSKSNPVRAISFAVWAGAAIVLALMGLDIIGSPSLELTISGIVAAQLVWALNAEKRFGVLRDMLNAFERALHRLQDDLHDLRGIVN